MIGPNHRPSLHRRSMGVLTAVVALTVGACSTGGEGDSAEGDDPYRGGAATSDSGNVPESIEDVLLAAGAEPDLAGCYQVVLDGAGVDDVADLREMRVAMAELDEHDQLKLAECIKGLSG